MMSQLSVRKASSAITTQHWATLCCDTLLIRSTTTKDANDAVLTSPLKNALTNGSDRARVVVHHGSWGMARSETLWHLALKSSAVWVMVAASSIK